MTEFQNPHAKKFHCNSCATISDFEMLDEELITKIEKEHTCPRCHASGQMELLFEIPCVKCQTNNLVNEEVYADGAGALAFKCEPCLAEEERIRREEEDRRRREEEERRHREEEERKRAEEEAARKAEELRLNEEEQERRIQKELLLQQENEKANEEQARAEAQARAEEELRLAALENEAMKSNPDSNTKENKQLAEEDFKKFKAKKSKEKTKKKSEGREYIEAFFTALLIALFLRAFVVEAFKIPSKSMVPNLLVGDHLFVNKFSYGLRLPLSKTWVTRFGAPKRGEVVVFSWPKDESLDFIKRVVGLPGDKITIDRRELFINDQKINLYPVTVEGPAPGSQKLKVQLTDSSLQGEKFSELPYMVEWKDYDYFVEDLTGVQHVVQYMKPLWPHPKQEWVVPPGYLFVMGDNRDNSSDSREWGFVPMENLRGKAMFIWFSWDSESVRSPWYALQDLPKKIRWNRFGKAIE